MLLAGAIASAPCLKRKGITAGPKNGVSEDHNTLRMTDLILSESDDYRNLLRLDVPSVGDLLKNITPTAVSTNSDTL